MFKSVLTWLNNMANHCINSSLMKQTQTKFVDKSAFAQQVENSRYKRQELYFKYYYFYKTKVRNGKESNDGIFVKISSKKNLLFMYL